MSGFKNRPCADCGGMFHPCQMDLDHVKGDKKFNVGQSIKAMPFEVLMEELEKCDVVCSNCHRLRTWNNAHKAAET